MTTDGLGISAVLLDVATIGTASPDVILLIEIVRPLAVSKIVWLATEFIVAGVTVSAPGT